MKYIFSAKSALHHQAAAHGRGPVQGEGEGGREWQTLRDRVRGGGGAAAPVSRFQYISILLCFYTWNIFPSHCD